MRNLLHMWHCQMSQSCPKDIDKFASGHVKRNEEVLPEQHASTPQEAAFTQRHLPEFLLKVLGIILRLHCCCDCFHVFG